jgi:tetratricopeptide (TPR) repeat protein
MIGYLPRVLLAILPLVVGGTVSFAQVDERDARSRRVLELQRAGRYEDAIELAKEHAEAIEVRYGERHPEYAAALRSLAGLFQEAKLPRRAEPLLLRALAIDETSLGPDDPVVAIDLNELGVLLTDTNRFADAEPLLRRALEIDERNLGADHRNVAVDFFNIGVLLRRANRLAEAEPFLRRALAIEEKNFGSAHSRVAVVLTDLALLLKASNRAGEAVELNRRVRAISEKRLRPPVPSPPAAAKKPVVRTEQPRPAPRPSAPEEVEIQRVR